MKMATPRFLPIGLLCAMSVACAPERIREVRDYNATFICDGDQPMQVRFSPFNAVLQAQGASIALIQQPAADGFFYTGGGQSLRAQGDDATWTDGKGAVHHCHAKSS
ncbi:MAG TPA: MliC family protein [Rhizomicrobium sp.]|nr:MliC family protein [Rhizomicrobium sp.]